MEQKEKDLQQESNNTEDILTEELEQGLTEDSASETVAEPSIAEDMKKLKQEHGELKDKYLRLFAEFDNFKKRTFKEKLEMMKTASSGAIQVLLPVLDDFDRAKKNAEDENSTEPFSEGVNLVYQKLYGALKNKGLQPMESNGEAFDPELHEAVTEIPVPDEAMKGKIVDTIERGYFLNEKLIRHAKVVVGK